MKPNYIVIGTGKAGTTSLCALLGRHPEVFMSEPKELNFFNDSEAFQHGAGWYEAHFDGAIEPVRGEGSPLYSFRKVFPGTAHRMAEYVPDAKLIYIVRHPLERIASAWTEMLTWGADAVHHRFDKALRVNREWLVDSSNYWREIGAYRKLFPDEQILTLFYDDFCVDQEAVVRRAFRFLGVDDDVAIDMHAALNVTLGKTAPRRSVSMLRTMPVLGPLWHTGKRLVPTAMRRRIRDRWLHEPVVSPPAFWTFDP